MLFCAKVRKERFRHFLVFPRSRARHQLSAIGTGPEAGPKRRKRHLLSLSALLRKTAILSLCHFLSLSGINVWASLAQSRASEKRRNRPERHFLHLCHFSRFWRFRYLLSLRGKPTQVVLGTTFGTTFGPSHDLGAPYLKSLALTRNPTSEVPLHNNIRVCTAEPESSLAMRQAVIVMGLSRDSRPPGAQGSPAGKGILL